MATTRDPTLGLLPAEEEAAAKDLAARYHLEFVDIASFAPDPELLQSVPVELMFRYNFLPFRRDGGRLVLVMADPTDIPGRGRAVAPAPNAGAAGRRHALGDPGSAQARPGDPAGPAGSLGVLQDPGRPRRRQRGRGPLDRQDPGGPVAHHPPGRLRHLRRLEPAGLGHPHRDHGPRGPDQVPDRRRALPRHRAHRQASTTTRSSAASRSCPSSTSPRSGCPRTAASGCRIRGRTIDFRVSIMPSVHGEDAVIRILDKEIRSNAAFRNLRLDVLGLRRDGPGAASGSSSASPTAWSS